ncbi:hypothetical protein NGRA_1046 [Nosema granulosis]|nr:hypothetical protein NGRA_1046 [Nosema granulosis]
MNSLKKDYYFVYCDLLDFYSVKKNEVAFKEIEKEALDLFGNEPSIIWKIFNYYYLFKDKERLSELVGLCKLDSRSLVMKGMYCSLNGDESAMIDYYKQAIDTDPTYFKPYILLCEAYKEKDTKQYKIYLDKAIKVAPTYSDRFKTYRLLTLEQNKEELRVTKKLIKFDQY